MTGNKTQATSWEASVAKTIMTTPRASSPYPDTLDQLEPEINDEIIDMQRDHQMTRGSLKMYKNM